MQVVPIKAGESWIDVDGVQHTVPPVPGVEQQWAVVDESGVTWAIRRQRFEADIVCAGLRRARADGQLLIDTRDDAEATRRALKAAAA